MTKPNPTRPQQQQQQQQRLPPAASARLKRELTLLHTDPPPGVAAYVPDESDSSHIRAQIVGPESSPFADRIFLLSVRITPRYPFEPPRCRFLTPVYHPNVDAGGRICLDTLKRPPAGSWSPAVSLPSLLLSIRTLMGEPNPDDGLMPEISDLYKTDAARWGREARRRADVDATAERVRELERRLDGGGGAEDEDEGGEGAVAAAAEGKEETEGGHGRDGGGGGGGPAGKKIRVAPPSS